MKKFSEETFEKFSRKPKSNKPRSTKDLIQREREQKRKHKNYSRNSL